MHAAIVRYQQSNGNLCPFCQSDQIETEYAGERDMELEMDGNCESCKRQWIERYSLMAIQEVG